MNEQDIKQAMKIMVSKMINARETIQSEACGIQRFGSTDHSPKGRIHGHRIKEIEVALGKIQKQVSELNTLDGALGMLAEIEEAKK